MVKRAKTDEEIRKVFEYLSLKGTVPNTRMLHYVEDEKGRIIGAYGLEVKTCIEPLQADNPRVAFELSTDAFASARMLGDKVYFVTDEEKIKEHVVNNCNAILWSKNVDEFLIEL